MGKSLLRTLVLAFQGLALATFFLSYEGTAAQKKCLESVQAQLNPPAETLETTALLAKVAKIMKDQDRKLRSLYSTTGFPRRLDYLRYLTDLPSSDPRNRELKEILRQVMAEEVDVAVGMGEESRSQILRTGIKNFRETGTSPNNAYHRESAEASYLGMTTKRYEALPDALKPKYGILRPTKKNSSEPPHIRSLEDRYILKMDRIRKRMTWSPGDSLNRLTMGMRAGLAIEPLKAIFRALMSVSTGTIHRPYSWDHLFIPWDHRELMAPFLKSNFEPDYRQGGSEVLKVKSYVNDYLEVQVWGEISPQDIQAFEFTKSPPSHEDYVWMREHGIEIRDARKYPAVPYREGN
ncbi:hypothetical protein WDW37_03015 [Bdellovibrionota bacterium FG-1]